MRYATTPCLNEGCLNTAVKNGRCEPHQIVKEWNKTYRKETLPKDWATRRRIVFQRDNYVCYLCGSNNPVADTIDHVIPGDNHDLDNLKPVHDINAPHCHRKKTAQDSHKAQQQNKIKYKR